MAHTQDNSEYNGWANWETWNVALWLQNDEAYYRTACLHGGRGYDALIPVLESNFTQCTPDGARWMDPTIDTDELDAMLAEL